MQLALLIYFIFTAEGSVYYFYIFFLQILHLKLYKDYFKSFKKGLSVKGWQICKHEVLRYDSLNLSVLVLKNFLFSVFSIFRALIF